MQETQEMQVQSLDQADPLEEEMATHSSILAWKIPWTEEAGGLAVIGLQRAGHTEQLSTHATICLRLLPTWSIRPLKWQKMVYRSMCKLTDTEYKNGSKEMDQKENFLLTNIQKNGEWKSWLKLNIQKTKIMTSSPISSWQIERETVRLYFLGLQNHCRWWLQPWN